MRTKTTPCRPCKGTGRKRNTTVCSACGGDGRVTIAAPASTRKTQFVVEERIGRSRVLARSAADRMDRTKRLVWQSGFTSRTDDGQRKYYPSQLRLEWRSSGTPSQWIVLIRGGRLTAARVGKVASRIDMLLGKGVAGKVLIGVTLVVR